MDLYEILVPATIDGCEIAIPYHREWDLKVEAIASGLTVLSPVKGYWVSPCLVRSEEPMIPVRIACSKEQIQEIAEMTKEHYEQNSIMYYKLSSEVYFV